MSRVATVPGVLVLLSSLAAAGVARAEPPGMTRPAPARKDTAPSRRSPALALGLGLGITGAGALAIAVHESDGPKLAPAGFLAMYIGPSIGRWYGGGSAAVGLIARTAAVAVVLSGIDDRPPDGCVPEPEFGEDCVAENEAQADYDRREKTRMYLAGALWFGSTIYDLVRAPLDAREFNREHAITVAPTVMRGGQAAALVPAVAVSGRF